MKLRWCWRCRRDVPMLDEVEYQQLDVVLSSCIRSIQHEREARGVSLEAIDLTAHYSPAVHLYMRLTGVALSDWEELRHHRDSLLGPDCGTCGRALRSPYARRCAECGTEATGRAQQGRDDP